MKRSSQQKILDVPAKTVSTSRTQLDAETSTAQAEDMPGAAMSDGSAFQDDSFEDEADNGFREDSELGFDDSMLDDAIAEVSLAEEDFWGDELEQKSRRPHKRYRYKDYLDDEFGIEPSEDPLMDLFADGNQTQSEIQPDIQGALKRGMIRALAAHDTPQFLAQVGRSLSEATSLLQSVTTTSQNHQKSKQLQKTTAANRNRHTIKPPTKQNGYHPERKQEIELQPLTRGLKQVQILVQRYAKRGLSEWDVLEDAIVLLADILLADVNSEVVLPILAGFAARLTLKPIIAQLDQPVDLSVRRQLFNVAHKATVLLNQHHALASLPGLAVNVGRYTVQRDRPLAQLPQDFYQAATRVTTNPDLQQRLTNFKFEENASFAIAAQQMPMKLCINGPIEILLRQPEGE